MLVLLVIFMITTPLLTQGVQVDLPQASAKPMDSQPKEPIVVSVDAAGKYYLNLEANPQAPIDKVELLSRVTLELNQSKARNEQRQVLIKGDKNVDYGKVIGAMVLLQQAGVNNVGLVTENFESSENQKST